ncbi:alcohol dehydrogenase family protein [Labrys monachus]|nr:alcohol dehydrogenase family protein [Labrys monachus]
MTFSIPAVMTAMVLTGHGDYDKLAYRHDVPVPRPRAGEVLIRVGAAGLNNTDINTRIGWYAPAGVGVDTPPREGGWNGAIGFPRIQGADVCGTIVAAGAGVQAGRIGERVIVQPCLRSLRQGRRDAWLGSEVDGGFAQFTCVPAPDAYRIESPLSDAELATFPCAYATAENLLGRSGVAAGERVLITGASGGVGAACVQLARRRGAEVIAVASGRHADRLEALGAARLVPRGAALASHVPPDSVDAVIDVVGGPSWPDLLDVLRPRGRYAVSGAVAGPIVSLDLRKLYLKDLCFFGCTSQDDGVFERLVGALESGDIRPLLAAAYPLSELARAQQDFLARAQFGKLVVVPPQA